MLGMLVAADAARASTRKPRTPRLLAEHTSAATDSRPPILFECNVGHIDGRVAARVRASSLDVYAEPAGLTFALHEPRPDTDTAPRRRYVVSARLAGASGTPPVVEQAAVAKISYFRGRPEEWVTGVTTAHALRYPDAWPGVGLLVEGGTDRLKYTFVVSPGADPALARLSYQGGRPIVVGSELWIETPLGTLRDGAPVAWQETGGGRVDVEVRYRATENEVGFEVGCFDPTLPLVIDPAVFVYAGYVGGVDVDYPMAVAVDGSGAAYLVGYTYSSATTFPVLTGPDLTLNGSRDAFIAKVDPSGGSLVYAGYIGGAAWDTAWGVAVDAQGAAYVTGQTGSFMGFPTIVGPDLTYGGNQDGFITKVDPSGTTLQYSGFIGGYGWDSALGVSLDATGRAVVVGSTKSDQASFPITGGPDPTHNGGVDGFLARVTPSGSALDLCTYLGGASRDEAHGVAIDPQGNIAMCGETYSDQSTFPLVVGPDLTLGGSRDGWVARLDASTNQLTFCGYLGGSAEDVAYGCAMDGLGRVYVTGETLSSDFPTAGGPDPSPNGGGDAFVVRLAPGGASFDYAGYLGGSGPDSGDAIVIDAAGRACLVGTTRSGDGSFPVVDGPDLTFNGGYEDAFVARLRPDGSGLESCGFIGGAGGDRGSGVAWDSAGAIYVTGLTMSTESTFPIAVGPDLTYNGSIDGFVAKIAPSGCAAIQVQPPSLPFATLGQAYAQSLTATGGTPPYTFSLAAGSLPPALALSPAGVISGTVVAAGRYPLTVRVVDAGSCEGLKGYVLTVKLRSDIVVAPGEGPQNPNRVRVFDPDGNATATDFDAYAAGAYGTAVGGGEIDGLGVGRILTGPGPGKTLGPQVRAFQATGQPIAKVNFYAYGSLAYGVNVVAGEMDGEGIDEILTGAGAGAVFGPHVRGFNYDGVAVATLPKLSFFAYGTLKYGVNVASGDVERDGYGEIVTGPGPGAAFAPTARGFDYDGQAVAPIATLSFNAFALSGYGLCGALGDVDADLRDEMAFTPGPGPAHPARVLGFDHDGVAVSPLPGFDATPYATFFGARGSLGRLAPNVVPRLELAIAPGADPAAPASVKGFRYGGASLTPLPWGFTAFPTKYGANVACPALGL